ncbi:MAG TPA: zinc-binding dehydrogenase [Acidimicrobiia bacterium]|nr:zinc-binding dehydrogenase [Acidimicrobiia bacterium]
MELPEQMTAAVLTAFGGPEALVVRHDVPVPHPVGEAVLIEVTGAGVNNTDIWTREGAYGRPGDPEAVAGWKGVPLDFPRVQGGDIAGRIVDVGSSVGSERIGQRVIVDPGIFDDTDGEEPELVEVIGSERDGGFAEYVAVPSSSAHDVSGSPLEDTQLACISIAYGTAMGMLERAQVRAGERILVTGASGGVGLALVQLAAARGAVVTALTSNGKAPSVIAAGAHDTVLRDEWGPDRDPVELDREFDVIADVVGDGVFEKVLPALRTGGRLVIAGAIAGPVVTLDLRVLYLQRRRLIGSTMHTPAHFEKLVEAVREGSIHPVVAETYPLVEIHRAQARFLDKEFVGKLVLVP